MDTLFPEVDWFQEAGQWHSHRGSVVVALVLFFAEYFLGVLVFGWNVDMGELSWPF